MIRLHTVVLSVAVSTLGYLAYLLWRRHADDPEEPPPPRYLVASAAEQTVVEVQIPSSAVGRIIGRQGANIKKLEQVSGARLHLDRDTGKRDSGIAAEAGGTTERMRVLTIRGPADAAQLAEVLVRRELASQPDGTAEVLPVPQYSIRHIIGPRGATIDRITDSTGARIKIGTRSHNEDDAVQVTISGEISQVEAAKEKLLSVVRDATQLRTAEQTSRFDRHRSSGTSCTSAQLTQQQVDADETDAKASMRCEFTDTCATDTNETPRSIKKLDWPNHKMYTAVFVSSYVSPAHFWVHVLELYGNQPQNVRALDDLRASMTEFYNERRTSLECDPVDVEEHHHWKEGDVVAARFPNDGHWYRAAIYKVLEDGLLDVSYFDYGDSAVIQRCEVQPLRAEYWKLPQQAIECYAIDMEPAGETWTDDALTSFEELAHVAQWKPLMARKVCCTQTETGEEMPCIVLIDTNSTEDISIANEMVKKGFAKRKPLAPTLSALT